MPARTARFMVDRNCDSRRTAAIETNRALNPQFHLRRRKFGLLRKRDSALRRPAISSVNLSANKC
jgi:hypothetical protein